MIVFGVGHVRSMEDVTQKQHVRGAGKDAEFRDALIGHKVILDNGTAFVFPPDRLPDCEVGDEVMVEFRRSYHKGEKK